MNWVITPDDDTTIDSLTSASTTATMGGPCTITANFAQVPSTPVQITNVQIPSIATQTGFMMPINVTLNNPDSVSETANVQINANGTSVFSDTITLSATQTETVPCYFNASVLSIGNYTWIATITTTSLSGTPSTSTTGQMAVTYLGDINGDFKVDGKDFIAFCGAYVQYWQVGGSHQVDPASDFNHDGKIDGTDFIAFNSAYVSYWE